MFCLGIKIGLFSFGNPTSGLWMIILSCIIYGMAFDFSGFRFIFQNQYHPTQQMQPMIYDDDQID